MLQKFLYFLAFTFALLLLAYIVSLRYYDTNNIINCTGKSTYWPQKLEGNYSIQKIKNRAELLGYETEIYKSYEDPANHAYDVTRIRVKKINTKSFLDFYLDISEAQNPQKVGIVTDAGGSYCKMKEQYVKDDMTEFLTEMNIETDWLNQKQIIVEKYHPQSLGDIFPHFQF